MGVDHVRRREGEFCTGAKRDSIADSSLDEKVNIVPPVSQSWETNFSVEPIL